MKRLTIVLLFVLFGYFNTQADEWVKINSDIPAPAKITLQSSSIDNSVIHFSLDGFIKKKVITERGEAFVLGLPKATPIMEKGTPDLPKLTASVIIPDLAGMQLKVVSSKVMEFKNMEIAPSKGNLYRDVDPAKVPFEYGPEYNINADFPAGISYLRDPYIIRDHRGQTVVVQPFTYNPVTKTLKVYYEMTVEVSKTEETGENPLTRQNAPEKIDQQFEKIYHRHFLNYAASASRYDPLSEYGNMLIICYDAFIPAMQPYLDWRFKAGRPTELVDVASIGNSAAIKSYIANYYNNNGLTFVLLVGDASQVPSSYSNGDSDNDYSYIVGNDHYPDLFIGRFSAENISHVETQVDRTLAYEQDPYTDIDWFTKGIGIASSEGPGDDGEYDYQHIRNLQDDLLAYTYTYCHELFDGSQGGNDASGNPTPAMVAEAVNDGATIINYTGHGSTTSWSSSGFSNGDVNNLTNNEMLPFIWSVACVNGNFVGNTCFAEAWMRAENNGEPAGAIATMMSTINQSWNPPMCGQDEMVDILVESYPDNINRTFGAISMHGCMQMNDEYGSGGDDMTDTWVCFGDPSLVVRTAVPQDITVSYQPTIFLGQNSLTVTSDAEEGLVSLTMDGQVLATAFIEGGSATLQFESLSNIGFIDIVITCYNFIPHINQIQIVPANIPYLMYESHSVNDSLNNNNNLIEPDETIFFTVNLNNIGGVQAENVEVELIMNDIYASFVDSLETYGNFAPGQTVGIPDAFCFTVSADAPDQHKIDFDIKATDSEDSTWISSFHATINAPVLNIGQMIINDADYGNGNGRLDPGETAEIQVYNSNTGHSLALNSIASISTDCQYIDLQNSVDTLGSIGFFSPEIAKFDVVVDPDAPDGAAIAVFNYELVSGMYMETETFSRKIGLLFDDFETGDFTKFYWQMDGDAPWITSMDYPYEGFFSAKSGTIDNSEESELSIHVEVMIEDSISFIRKVSSENGDKLKFYINNSLKAEWSGTTEGWTREVFHVGTGWKTFKWVYKKNGGNSQGADCAWLDYVIFPPLMCLTTYAGPDDVVCEGDNYQCQGEATDYTSVEWTTSGTGTFDDPNILDPVYTPSTDDIASGLVALTLTAWDDEGNSVDDETNLGFIDEPVQPEKPVGPDYVDVALTPSSEYTIAPVEDAGFYEWIITPAEAGTTESTSTTAIVTWSDQYLGNAEISVRAANDCGSGDWSEAINVFVDNTTGIALQAENNLKIYPNPVTDQLSLEFSGLKGQKLEIYIYNNISELVYTQSIVAGDNNTVSNIDLSANPDGIYFVKMVGKNETIVQKFIKK